MVTIGALSHIGRKRVSNQDSFCALAGLDSPYNSDVLLAVADGIGSQQAGEVASGMAIQGLISKLSRNDWIISPSDGADTRLKRAIIELNREVYAAAALPATRGMGTTLTAAVIVGSALSIGHVGDSRAYLLREDKILQLTQDHNWAAEQIAKGLIDCGQTEINWARNVLTRAIGVAPNVDVDGVAVEAKEGDMFLICSDGVHSLIENDALFELLVSGPPQSSCQAIVDMANARGGHDNITAVVCRIDGLVPPASGG